MTVLLSLLYTSVRSFVSLVALGLRSVQMSGSLHQSSTIEQGSSDWMQDLDQGLDVLNSILSELQNGFDSGTL